MNEIEIRRMYLTDEQWNRTNETWKQLKPRKNFNKLDPSDETLNAYSDRIKLMGFNIPLPVLDQWIFTLYFNRNGVNNYGWIDYRQVVFTEKELTVEELKGLFVIEEYREYVEMRASSKSFDDFMCMPKDKAYWREQSTWRIPPVVLDTDTFSNMPAYAEIGHGLQLIEGHTRLGYLKAFDNIGMMRTHEHRVYLLQSSGI